MANRLETGDNNEEQREALGHFPEVFLADLERDIVPMAALFEQPSAIAHLSGIAPHSYPPERDVRKFRRNRPRFDILIANEEELSAFYNTPGRIALKTVDENGEMDGTVTVNRPAPGILVGEESRLVVADSSKGLKKGFALAAAGTALIVSDKGLGATKARAAVILGVPGAEIAQHIYESLGYRRDAELLKNCVSWDPETGEFVERNVQPYTLDNLSRQSVRDLERFLPKDLSGLRR